MSRSHFVSPDDWNQNNFYGYRSFTSFFIRSRELAYDLDNQITQNPLNFICSSNRDSASDLL